MESMREIIWDKKRAKTNFPTNNAKMVPIISVCTLAVLTPYPIESICENDLNKDQKYASPNRFGSVTLSGIKKPERNRWMVIGNK